MKINPIFTNNLYQINNNRSQQLFVRNNSMTSDCFVKLSGISFGSLPNSKERQQKVDAFMSDLVPKTRSSKFSINDISNSVRKYAKNVNVKPLTQAPKELLFSNYLQGLYAVELAYDSSDNKFFIPKKNKNFYVKTDTLNKELGNVWGFVNAAHEFTHVLQYEDTEACQIGLFNKYIDKNKNDVDGAIAQINVAIRTVNSIEESIARPFIDTLIQNENMAFTRMESGSKTFLSWLCRKNKTEDFSSFVREKVETGIKKSEKENDITLDKKLVFDATINHFEKEIEAYKNENKAHKLCTTLDSPRALTRIELYEKSIEVLKEMKNEI